MEQQNNTEQEIKEVQRQYKKLTSWYGLSWLLVILACTTTLAFGPAIGLSDCTPTHHEWCGLGLVVWVFMLGVLALIILYIIFFIISFFYWKKYPVAFSVKEKILTSVPILIISLVFLWFFIVFLY